MGQLYLAKAVELYERGIAAGDEGDLEQAVAYFADALHVQPNYVEAMIAQGNLTLQLGDAAAAVGILEEAVRLAPEDPTALVSLGIAYFLTGEEEQALDYWDRTLQANPDLPVELVIPLAELMLTTGLLDRARDLLVSLLERAPDNPEVHTLLGHVLFEMEDLLEARAEADKALALDDTWVDAHYLRGIIALEQDDLNGAAQAFTRERDLDPDSPRGETMLAETLFRQGQHASALAMVDAVLQREELDADTLLTCAQIYAHADKPEAAIVLLQDVLEFDPTDDEAAVFLLDIATKSKDRAALQWLRDNIADEDEELLQLIDECEQRIGPTLKTRGKKSR
jgi:tetratricopeptide (TPR) repeat protein